MMAEAGLWLQQIRVGEMLDSLLTVCITIQHDTTPNGLTAAHGAGDGLLCLHLANEGDIHGRHSAALWANQLADVAVDLDRAPCSREAKQCASLCRALGGHSWQRWRACLLLSGSWPCTRIAASHDYPAV